MALKSVPTISIVIPVYNEAPVLALLFAGLKASLAGLEQTHGAVEVVLVNDGSSDASWSLISAQCDRDPRYVGVNLSRNFGHQFALVGGLETARGEVVISMDADLQDPPEVLPQLVAKYRDGYDVVYATRLTRGRERWGKRITADVFYRIIEKVSGVTVYKDTGDFRLMSRRALVELSRMREVHRFLRGMVPWIGFPQTQVFYDRGDRAAGETHYPWHKMLALAFDGIASMSTAPLRSAYLLCLLLFSVFIGYIMWVLFDHFVYGSPLVQGWTSIMSAITIFGTIELLMFGIFGEYLGRTYEQVKQRPLYIIAEVKHGSNDPSSPPSTPS
ncbi:MAG: glycosyltransferase family 2 protein [Verrucomicrobiota bacterium]